MIHIKINGKKELRNMDKKFDEIVLREKERKLFISRLPMQVKEEFIKLANEEFCEDYGMAFKHVWDNFKLWKVFFENTDYKLDEILRKLDNTEEKPESITMLSGRKVKGGKKK